MVVRGKIVILLKIRLAGKQYFLKRTPALSFGC